jgi:tripartite-type tricarboxylate transporter receptor subunit TctC
MQASTSAEFPSSAARALCGIIHFTKAADRFSAVPKINTPRVKLNDVSTSAGRALTSTIAALIVTALYYGDAWCQSYPTKPVRLVAPFPAGGGTDIIARLIGRRLGESFGQSFVVDNRTGAAGIIGCENVARSAPDGYTLLMGTTGTHTTNPAVFPKLSYDPVKDFAPISLVAESPFVLVVHPSLPVKNVKELIALAKARPETLTYASSGIGGIAHFGFALFDSMAGIKMIHVPYKGSPLQTQATVAGEVTMTFDSVAVTQPFLKAKRIRALGVGTAKRSSLLPDVPTISEAGVTGFEMITWYALFAPAAIPADIIRTLNREVVKALATRGMREEFATLGSEPIGSTPEELAATVQRDLRKWAKVARDSGIKAE